jgi:hypothetical protein
MAERCRRKLGVKFSAVFVTARFRIVLNVFGENFAFLAKVWSQTNCCRRKCGVKLCAFGNVQRIQRRSEIVRFRRIRGVKPSVFAENAEWNGAFSAITRYSRKSGSVLGFIIFLNQIFLILGLSLIFYWMMPKNCEKRTIKSRACVPLRGLWWPRKCSVPWRLYLWCSYRTRERDKRWKYETCNFHNVACFLRNVTERASARYENTTGCICNQMSKFQNILCY